MSGKRTEILLGLEVLIKVLEKLRVIPDNLKPAADSLSAAILGAIPVTLAEKIKKVQETADKVMPDVG